MELYVFDETIDVENLKGFCLSKKKKFTSGDFYFLVLFDSRNNATFPKSPFTAEYGMEEDVMLHIRAFYTYNRNNGYSKLSKYEKNKWQSSAETYDL